ncbi:uncharacterized protein LOC116298495 [Actinia tenebrosa]|uniref:Uncharacterized protein LOC116298495 n=1 Tax=Actinia tenebrosa TaxID=6105 RepID=A0A6P8I2T8_ACTTE|nr:uncharacterized protein LOC116298495 [Actinia tenebrosa]
MLLGGFGLKRADSDVPPSKPDSVLVAETLMNELESQMKIIEDLKAEREREEKRRKNTADYSWLISTPNRHNYQLSPVDRLVLEELSTKVRPEHSGEIISQFRTMLETRSFELSEIPKVFRCLIERYLAETKDLDNSSTLKWLTRSLTDLGSSIKTIRSQSSSKVYPLAVSKSDVDEQTRRVQSMPEFVAMRDLAV